jgi:hypothetical protein
MKSREIWGVPDWKDASAYPQPEELSDKLWRWEFVRRMHDYRLAWDRAAPIQYELSCRQAEKSGRDQRLIRKPDDVHFTVSSIVYSFPEKFSDLIKYKVKPIHNPRLSPPRFFEDGPSILRFSDEDGGVLALAPKPNTRQEPVIIPAGWTLIGIDLTEPLPAQFARARQRLEQLQMNHAEEWNFGDRLKAKEAARRRKTLWPRHLRVLDARDEGVSYQEIGIHLNGLEVSSSEWEGLGPRQADAVLDRIARAKSDAKKWHRAALRVAISDDR